MTAAMPRARLEFDAAAHAYTLNGSRVPSVTQVLESEGLAGSVWYTEAARKRGSAVHAIALLLGKRPWRGSTPEEIIENSLWDPAKTTPMLIPYGVALARWYLATGFRPALTEQPVYSLKFGIAGTLDQWGEMPDKSRWLIDFKSGQPQPAADLQTALYAMCLEESLGYKTDQRAVIWLRPEADYKMQPARPVGGQDLAISSMAVNLYKWRQAHKMLT